MTDKSEPKQMYQHYVPRFLLNNFGRLPQGPKPAGQKKRPKTTSLCILNLKEGNLAESDSSRTFGEYDMYKDFTAAEPCQNEIEDELCKLERSASIIFDKILKEHGGSQRDVYLSRKEYYDLRKFLFIMTYRNKTFHTRFTDSMEEYNSNDREQMLAYMKSKGFESPKDVWFSNIRGFLFVDHTKHPNEWKAELEKSVYPPDALWFYKNVEFYFVSTCTPTDVTDDFLMTQNAFSIYEGPNSGEIWSDYHLFAPVSPKVMLIMRNVLLPSGPQDDDAIRQGLQELYVSHHIDPPNADSWLKHLPLTSSRVNFTNFLKQGSTSSIDHRNYRLSFSSLPRLLVQRINTIFLENALGTVAIVYKSSGAFRTAIEHYLAEEEPGFKLAVRCSRGSENSIFCQEMRAQRLVWLLPNIGEAYLKLLEATARSLGSTCTARYPVVELSDGNPTQKGADFFSRYKKLGGNIVRLKEDMAKARSLMQVMIKIDCKKQTGSNEEEAKIYETREQLVCSLPTRCVWLFVKYHMNIERYHQDTARLHVQEGMSLDGIEDAIVDARQVFKAESLSRIIYRIGKIELFQASHPEFGVKGVIIDRDGLHRIKEEMRIMLEMPGEPARPITERTATDLLLRVLGSITECGIQVIEDAADAANAVFSRSQSELEPEPLGPLQLFLTPERSLELAVRYHMSMHFNDLLKTAVDSKERQKLKEALFHHLYRYDVGGRVAEGMIEPWPEVL